MLICIDIGNTNITIGIYDGDELKVTARLATDSRRTSDQYAIEIRDIIHIYEIERSEITDAAICSVVPTVGNAVERAVILCTGDLITGPELPASVTGAAEQAAPVPETAEASRAGLSLEALERRAIEDTLRQTEDNKSEAARRLGITRATLHNKLRKYGLE